MTTDFASLGGWINDPTAVEATLATMPRPLFATAAASIAGTGEGKTTLLYKAWADVNGSYPRLPAQEIGCCVGRGFASGVDLLQAVERAIRREAEEYKETSHEFIYGASRVDIGGQRGSYSDGSVGAWAAKAVTTLGVVPREWVGPYDDKRAKDWGAKGPPAELKAKAKEHLVGTASLVATWAELEDAIANGYPVPICSDQGFTMERDAEGFCSPRGTWNHCMMVCAVRNDKRPGACIYQSWGPNVPSGPLSLDQPDNSFWADRKVVERILSQRDSYALSAFAGYPGRPLPGNWTWAGMA